MIHQDTCYFAHHVTDYGTSRELEAIGVLERRGFEVINPNSPEHSAAYAKWGMAHFLGVVATCDNLAFQRFTTGQIGAGVGKEISAAASRSIAIYEITDSQLVEFPFDAVDDLVSSALTVEATRSLIAAIRASHG